MRWYWREKLAKWGWYKPWRKVRLCGRECGCIVVFDRYLERWVTVIGCEDHWVGEIWHWEDI